MLSLRIVINLNETYRWNVIWCHILDGLKKTLVGYVLMVVEPLMAGAGGLNIGRELRLSSTQD
jgi:hypothetical protein